MSVKPILRDRPVCDVEIEDLDSWPTAFRKEAEFGRSLVCQYQTERLRIDHLAESDIHIRLDPPANKHKALYLELIEELESRLVPHRIVGFHCTRLTFAEVNNVVGSGLKPLSLELICERIESCISQGLLDKADGEYLRESPAIRRCISNQNGRRTGLLWFCPNRSSLADYYGISRFFRMWGGEALYWGHEDDSRIATVLLRLGVPCVIKCAVPYSHANHYGENLSERFLAHLVADEIEYPEPSAIFDLFTETNISPSGILQVIVAGSAEFESLTHFQNWPRGHRFLMPTDD
jgi:hypothetical protein